MSDHAQGTKPPEQFHFQIQGRDTYRLCLILADPSELIEKTRRDTAPGAMRLKTP